MSTDHLSQTFATLADLPQRPILAQLELSETSITASAECFGLTLPAIATHLTVPEIDVAFAPNEPHDKATVPGGIRRTPAIIRKTP